MKATRLTTAAAALAALTLAPPLAHSQTVQPAWAVVPEGTTPPDPPSFELFPVSWMSTASNVRGVAANPANGNVLVADTSRNVRVLDAAGREQHVLDTSGLATGATLNMVHVRVADDGAVFATNLSATSPPSSFKIWRWENDSNPAPDPLPEGFEPVVATVAWEGDPAEGANSQRWGDSFDVRGAGASTQLVLGARQNPVLCVLDTADGLTFSPHLVTYVGSPHLGVTFGPDITGYDDPGTPGTVENLTLITVFAKSTGNVMNRVAIRTDTWSVVSTTPYNGGANPPAVAAAITAIAADPSARFLGGVAAATSGAAFLYDIDNATASPGLISQQPFFTANPNGNGIAAADVFVARPGQTPGQNGIPSFNRFYALNVNNGLIAYDIIPAVLPPAIVAGPPSGQPADTTVIAGWKAGFTVTATGTAPLTYQWLRDDEPIAQATGPFYQLDPVTAADSGAVFTVRVSNAAGTVTSSPATLTVQPRVDTAVLTPAWSLPVGQRAYVDQNNTQRGLAHNPAHDHLLLVNRSTVPGLPAPPNIIVLNAATGAEIMNGNAPRVLRLTDEFDNPVVTGGTFTLNMIDCDTAGVVYAANLAESATVDKFTVYRWQDDDPDTIPTIAFGPGDVFGSDRCGDQFKVRGSGVNTQLLVGARNQEKCAVFTTTDGVTFTPTVFEVPGAGPTSFFQCDFGAGDTVWAKASGGRLLHVSFDLGTGLAAIEQAFTTAQFPSGVAPIGLDPARNLLGAVHIGENPNNLRLYDHTLIGEPGGLLDLEFFPTDNPNGNGSGGVDFGNNRVYALDTNNGIVAMNITFTPAVPAPAVLTAVEYVESAGGDVLRFTLTGEPGASYRLERSPTLAAAAWTTVETIALAGTSQLVEISLPAGQETHFYRAVTLP
jgi:hypothetical protein